MRGRNAAKAFQDSRAARFADNAKARADRAPSYLVVPESEVRDTDEVMHTEGGNAFVRREKGDDD